MRLSGSASSTSRAPSRPLDRAVISKLRACVWALAFGLFFHIALDEHHGVFSALCRGVFWTAIVDSFISGGLRATLGEPK